MQVFVSHFVPAKLILDMVPNFFFLFKKDDIYYPLLSFCNYKQCSGEKLQSEPIRAQVSLNLKTLTYSKFLNQMVHCLYFEVLCTSFFCSYFIFRMWICD